MMNSLEKYANYVKLNKVGAILFVVTMIVYESNSNQICDPEFQNTILSSSGYQYVPSNPNCWYAKGQPSYQVKRIWEPSLKNVVELVGTLPYTLCQKVLLVEGTQYNISFIIANPTQMYWSIIEVSLNNTVVASHRTDNALNITYAFYQFYSLWNDSQLCFKPSFQKKFSFFPNFLGPAIDNVVLIESYTRTSNTSNNMSNSSNASSNNSTNNSNTNDSFNNSSPNNSANTTTNTQAQNQTINVTVINGTNNTQSLNSSENQTVIKTKQLLQVYCSSNSQQTYYDIVLFCKYQVLQLKYVLNLIRISLIIYCDNEIIRNYTVQPVNDYQLKITLIPDKILVGRSVTVEFIQNLQTANFNSIYDVKFYVNGKETTFLMLQKSEVATLKAIEPVVTHLSKAIKNCFTSLRTTFFSFFIIDLISFWNLTLMYNFLSIETVPTFSKNFLENLVSVLFKFGSIVEWMKKRFPALEKSLDFSQTAGREQMQELIQNSSWFGVFGFSSGFLNNNTQQIISFFLLLVKMLLVRLLRLLLKSCLQFKNLLLPKDRKLLSVFLLQLIGCTIFLNISASTCILDIGLASPKEKVNLLIQVLCLLFCVLLTPSFFIVEVGIRGCEIKQIERRVQAGSSNKNLCGLLMKKKRSKILSVLNDVLNYVPYFTVTFLIVVRSSVLFLVVNSVVILARVVFFLRYKKRISPTTHETIFLVLNLLIWLVHHSTYVVFFILSRVYSDSSSFSGEGEKIRFVSILKVGGFITIFTVLLGGFLQTANLLFEMLHKLLRLIKFVKKKCMQNRTRQINVEENQVPKQNVASYQEEKIQKLQKSFNNNHQRKNQIKRITSLKNKQSIKEIQKADKIKIPTKIMLKIKQLVTRKPSTAKNKQSIKAEPKIQQKEKLKTPVKYAGAKKNQIVPLKLIQQKQQKQFKNLTNKNIVSRAKKLKTDKNLTKINNKKNWKG